MTILVLLSIQLLFCQEKENLNSNEKHVVYSNVIGEEKEYWIHLPNNYDKSEGEYPVLFITDGDEFFYLASGTSEFMSTEYLIPECIVVGILHNNRNHDLTPTHSTKFVNGLECNAAKVSGGGDTLLQFIEKELIPRIENNYRTGPYRIFAGHSLGGLLSVYAYLNYNYLFDAFIAMDPALNWDNNLCENLLNNKTYLSTDLESRLYISSAHNAPSGKRDKSALRLSQEAFCEELKKNNIENIKHEYFEEQNHMTVPYRSLYEGLVYSFPGYYILEDPMFKLDTAFLGKFYATQSKTYGMVFEPSERLIEMFGKYFLYDINDYYNAIKFFELDTIYYPDSYRAYKYLGMAYLATNKKEGAVVNFLKARELNPKSEEIIEMLYDLGVQQ